MQPKCLKVDFEQFHPQVTSSIPFSLHCPRRGGKTTLSRVSLLVANANLL